MTRRNAGDWVTWVGARRFPGLDRPPKTGQVIGPSNLWGLPILVDFGPWGSLAVGPAEIRPATPDEQAQAQLDQMVRLGGL